MTTTQPCLKDAQENRRLAQVSVDIIVENWNWGSVERVEHAVYIT